MLSLFDRGRRKKKVKESLCREEGSYKVQVSLVSPGGDIGSIQEDDTLDKLASSYSRNDILDKKDRRNNSKVRRCITTEI